MVEWAIAIGAIGGVIVAILSIRANRAIACKRATLDVILRSESDEYFQRIYSVFISESKRPSGLQALLKTETDNEKNAKKEVDNFLNHYELIAISIDKKILDEDFYKRWMCSTYIRHYKASKDYIEESRKASSNVYTNFQSLAEKWDKEQQASDCNDPISGYPL